MSQVPVKWAVGLHLEEKQTSICQVPVVPLSALRDWLKMMANPFHGPSDLQVEWDASGSELTFEQWAAHRLLASLGEVGK